MDPKDAKENQGVQVVTVFLGPLEILDIQVCRGPQAPGASRGVKVVPVTAPVALQSF